jgi:hypothetical protein
MLHDAIGPCALKRADQYPIQRRRVRKSGSRPQIAGPSSTTPDAPQEDDEQRKPLDAMTRKSRSGKTKPVKPRNPAARALRDPRFRPSSVKSGKTYSRKRRERPSREDETDVSR